MDWTKARIDGECLKSYRIYERDLKKHYVAYFRDRPWLRSTEQTHSARDIASALPPGWSKLEDLIPRSARHLHARSAKSSQTLALALLGAAAVSDASLSWFWDALEIDTPPASRRPAFCFEKQLARADLGEEPHTTQLDFVISDPSCFLAIESKWAEQGFDVCSCLRRSEGSHLPGSFCGQRVLERLPYWEVARDFFRLPTERLPLLPCQIAPMYQVLRNIAAARALGAGTRRFGFVLLYDQNNPFFRPSGSWPGWPAVLTAQLDGLHHQRFIFRAIAWQQLMKHLPLDENVRQWAREKHRLW